MQSFLLVFYGNTGSSWLIQTLGNTPGVLVPGFEPLDEWAWDAPDADRLSWLRTVLSPPEGRAGSDYEAWLDKLAVHPHFRAPADPGFSQVGFKMRSHSIHDRLAVLETLRDLNTRVMVLERGNRIKHALSLYRYHEEDKSQFDKSGVRPPSEVDLEVFHGWVTASVDLHRQSEVFWAKALAVLGRDALLRLQYEEFIDEDGKAGTMARLAEFLDIEGSSYAGSQLEKATSDTLRQAVVNLDQLTARYAGTEFERYF